MARDIIHYAVRNALIRDGWHIASDPLTLKSRDTKVFIDLEVTRFLLANKAAKRIAVEIKSFRKLSVLDDFYSALEKYLCYKSFLKSLEMKHELYLGITGITYKRLLKSSMIRTVIQKYQLKFVIIQDKKEKIIEWIN